MVNRVLQDGYLAGASSLAEPMSVARPSRTGLLWSAINRNPVRTLAAIIAFYLAIACAQATTRLLWCDELITLAIARQGSLAAIWRALAAGADPNPPLSHWLVLQSIHVFGQGALAVRLPAILCVLLATVSLWAILRLWVCPGYAAVGVLAFMATRGFDYAYEARSYALLMGFGMTSLAFWLNSTERRGTARLVALAGMTAALALGVCSNYYGVLAFFPIAAGEAMRLFGARRVQPEAWLAMALAATPLLVFLPLIRHNLLEFVPHAWNRPKPRVISESYLVLVEVVLWPVLGLALYVGWKRWRTAREQNWHWPDPAAPLLQPYEAAALATLILYPVLGYLIAVGGAGMIGARCVVPVCCGFGIAAGLLGRKAFAGNARAGVIVLSALLFWVAARESVCAVILAQQRTAFFALLDDVAREPLDRPIVVADSLFVLPLAHYSSEQVRARIVFPIDFDAIHAIEPDDSIEENLWAGRNGIFPIQVVAYDSSWFGSRDLTVIARPNGWLTRRLTRDGFHLSQPDDNFPWQGVGGVFTSLDRFETRLFLASR
jgi:hypothetical protein